MVGLKNTQGKAVEDVKITIQFPKMVCFASSENLHFQVGGATLTSSFGSVSFDDLTKVGTCQFGIDGLRFAHGI